MESPSLEFRVALLEQQVAKLLAKSVNEAIVNEPIKDAKAYFARFYANDPRNEI